VKVNEGIRALWAKVVASVPDARLLLHIKESRARSGLLEFLATHGLPPERVTLIGYQDGPSYMATYGQIDIALDPSPFAGGTTTFDALWMGVPVVVKAGGNLVSRMGASFMSAAGLNDWVAETDADYVRIAASMARDRQALLTLKRGLRERLQAAPAWDIDQYTRDFENALRQMWLAHVQSVSALGGKSQN
jgi:predicted O-linked N-acetylglucosamine transferase (SPINDLY family)